MKFLFSVAISSSDSIMGTLVSKFPLLMSIDASIKLDIGLKNLDANLIATEIERNNNKVTTIK